MTTNERKLATIFIIAFVFTGICLTMLASQIFVLRMDLLSLSLKGSELEHKAAVQR